MDVRTFRGTSEDVPGTSHASWKVITRTFLHITRISIAALLKTAFGYYKHEAMHKDCELCLEKFGLELLKNIDITLMFEKDI